MPDVEIFIGYDGRERTAWEVCARSIIRHAALPPTISPIGMGTLNGRYRRPTERVDGILIDKVSDAPMSTEFALARFFVPCVARAQLALFCDADFMFRADVAELFALADPRFAVQVVKHDYHPVDKIKMDGQPQSDYQYKLWSSLVLWNMVHAANKRLWQFDLDTRPGLWFHQFGWLRDDEIGEIDPSWNWLDGVSDPSIEPKAVHFTNGTPDMPGHENSLHAFEWNVLAQMGAA
ncbi:MAG: hypothetical protein NUV75_01925 [Gallionella sp.]|nr:hypothetical protein [Gallionella sp.]